MRTHRVLGITVTKDGLLGFAAGLLAGVIGWTLSCGAAADGQGDQLPGVWGHPTGADTAPHDPLAKPADCWACQMPYGLDGWSEAAEAGDRWRATLRRERAGISCPFQSHTQPCLECPGGTGYTELLVRPSAGCRTLPQPAPGG